MQTDTSSVMMSMMRSSLDSGLGGIHQMEALHHQHHQASTYSQHAVTPSSQQASSHPQHTHHPETALRMHQQAEAILRSHTEAAFRLAASVAATNGSNANSTSTSTGTIKSESSAHQQRQINGSELHSSPHRFQSNASQPHPHPQPQSQQEQQPNPHNSWSLSDFTQYQKTHRYPQREHQHWFKCHGFLPVSAAPSTTNSIWICVVAVIFVQSPKMTLWEMSTSARHTK